jgi:hypothetical protein
MRSILFLLILGLPLTLASQSDGGLRFLSIGTDPVQLASAETMAASTTGATTLFANPALMGFETSSSLGLSNTFWLDGAFNRTAAWVQPSRFGTFGFGVLSSTVTDIEARQTPGPPDGLINVTYLSFTGGYAKQFGLLSVGFNASWLSEQLFDYSATGYSVGGGIAARLLDDRIRLGSTVQHLGKMDPLITQSSPLPSIWRTGVSADIIQFSVNGSSEIPIIISTAADVHVPLNEEEAYASAAMNVTVSDVLTFYGGFRTGDTRRPFGTGLSIQWQQFRFAYALVPFDAGFGMTHTLGINIGI